MSVTNLAVKKIATNLTLMFAKIATNLTVAALKIAIGYKIQVTEVTICSLRSLSPLSPAFQHVFLCRILLLFRFRLGEHIRRKGNGIFPLHACLTNLIHLFRITGVPRMSSCPTPYSSTVYHAEVAVWLTPSRSTIS